MAEQYLSEFYSLKLHQLAVPTEPGRMVLEPATGPAVDAPGTPLEQQIQEQVALGSAAYLQGKYAPALDHYLTAWSLFPKLVLRTYPSAMAKINPAMLLDIDLSKSLLDVSAQTLRYRTRMGSKPIPPLEPLERGLENALPMAGRLETARAEYETGLDYAEIGQTELAELHIRRALELADDDDDLQADVAGALGALELIRGNSGEARKHFGAALQHHARSVDGTAAMQHNLAVVSMSEGDVDQAGELFKASATTVPGALNWQVTQSFNPGLQSVTRAVGKIGLPVVLKDGKGSWVELAIPPIATPEKSQTVFVGSQLVELDLSAGPSVIEELILKPRVTATTLQSLDTHLSHANQWVSYLTHSQGYILPMALGDTYFALGDYEKAAFYYIKARDYPYLNLAIERPHVWSKLGRTYLEWGNVLYRAREAAGAKQQYEKILVIIDGGYDLSGPLYERTFADLRPETLAFLTSDDHVNFSAIDYSRRTILLEALVNLQKIAAGINYLGFHEDFVPIHSWRYLQNMARYFATQAMQAERAYVNFQSTSEKEAFTRLTLEQATKTQEAARDVEWQRGLAANEQLAAAQAALILERTRLENANAQQADYAATSATQAKLDEMSAFLLAPYYAKYGIPPEWNAGWGQALGLPGLQPGPTTIDTLMMLISQRRSFLTRELELANFNRKVSELGAATDVAVAQVALANASLGAAKAQYALAELAVQQAHAQLAHFDAREFTPELWHNLALAQRQISQRYLDSAIGAAFLMERAYEVEYDVELQRIRFDYGQSALHGLLAADFLLADIDQFSYDRLRDPSKQSSVKVSVALADRYPYQFNRQFQTTGRLDFQIFLEDFDRWHPGSHLSKLRRVEVVVEGLIGPRGIYGTLSNTGASFYRDRQGRKRIRLQRAETMILSRFDFRNDGVIFSSDDEQVLAPFENSGMAGGWVLSFPPEANDVDYRAISNVHLVFYFDCFYSERVANVARAELAAGARPEHSLGMGLAWQYPDEFFALQQAGEMTMTITEHDVPLDHTDPVIRDVYLLIDVDQEGATQPIPVEGLVITVVTDDGAVSVDQATYASGMIGTDNASAPLNVLRGRSLKGTWTVRIDEDANAAAFTAGFGWDRVRNLLLFVDYTYTPRGRQPAYEAFTTDPLAAFDVVDDPQAVQGPSSWSYDPAGQRIVQTSNIHAPEGNANLNADPNKPGTYLVHRTTADWPELGDLIVRCRLSSGDDDGIGVVFRYKDPDNFYFFLMDAQRNYRRLGKKAGGVFQELDEPFRMAAPGVSAGPATVDTANRYVVGQEYEVTIAAVGDALKVYLDGVEIMSGSDSSFPGLGRVGFYAWGNSSAAFLDLMVQPA
jgi:hypothetical protein